MAPQIILEKASHSGVRYQLRRFADNFIIFKLGTKMIPPQKSLEVWWDYAGDFCKEIEAGKALAKLLRS